MAIYETSDAGSQVCDKRPVSSVGTRENHKCKKTLYCTYLTDRFMTKAELVDKMAGEANITKAAAAAALESFMDAVEKALKAGDKLTLVGFGTFSVLKRAARVGRNPFTGQPIKIKAKKVARFKASKELSGKLL